jgi:hypothetical protein
MLLNHSEMEPMEETLIVFGNGRETHMGIRSNRM